MGESVTSVLGNCFISWTVGTCGIYGYDLQGCILPHHCAESRCIRDVSWCRSRAAGVLMAATSKGTYMSYLGKLHRPPHSAAFGDGSRTRSATGIAQLFFFFLGALTSRGPVWYGVRILWSLRADCPSTPQLAVVPSCLMAIGKWPLRTGGSQCMWLPAPEY